MRGRNYPYKSWSAGGGGGGGGTTDCCYETITQAALVALKVGATLEAGRTYLITDVTADWQVMIRATSTSELTTQGNAIYQGTLYVEAWYDLMTNTLWKVYDPKYNNEVEIQANVLAFNWNNPNWYNNKIVGGSQIFVNGGTSITFFCNNEINSGSTVDLQDGILTTFDLNSISEGSYLQISSSTLTTFTGNEISAQSSVSIQSTTITNFNGNQISAGTSVLLLSLTMIGVFSNNNIVDSNVNLITATVTNFHSNTLFQGTVVGNTTTCNDIIYNVLSGRGTLNINTLNRLALVIRDNQITQGSTITLSGVIVMNLFNGNSATGQSSITIAGGSCPSFSRNILEDATITATAMAIVTAVSDNNLLTGSSMTLNGCTSTLVQYNVLSGTSQMICTNTSVTNIQKNTLASNSVWTLSNSSGTNWLGNSFNGMSDARFQSSSITNLKYNTFTNFDGVFGGSGLTCPNFLMNTINGTDWTWTNLVIQQFIQKNNFNGAFIVTTGSTLFSFSNNIINTQSSISILGALTPTQIDHNVIQTSQLTFDGTSSIGSVVQNVFQNAAVVDFRGAVINQFTINNIQSGFIDLTEIQFTLFTQNRINNATIYKAPAGANLSVCVEFRTNIINNSEVKFYENRTIQNIFDNEFSNSIVQFNTDTTDINDNYVLDSSSLIIENLTATYIRYNHITHGSTLNASASIFTGGGMEYVTVDNNSTWNEGQSEFQATCQYIFITNNSILTTEQCIFKGDFNNINADGGSTITLSSVGVATAMKQVEVLSASTLQILGTATDLQTFEQVSLVQGSIYNSADDSITDVIEIRLLLASSIILTATSLGLMTKMLLKNSTVTANAAGSGTWEKFNFVDSQMTIADVSSNTISEINLTNTQLTTGTNPSFTNIRIEGLTATIDGAYTDKTAIKGVVSNFDTSLDCSNIAIYTGTRLLIPASYDYVGIFNLINVPGASTIDEINNAGTQFTWNTKYFSDNALQWTTGGTNLVNAGAANVNVVTSNDFIEYEYRAASGKYYEYNSVLY